MRYFQAKRRQWRFVRSSEVKDDNFSTALHLIILEAFFGMNKYLTYINKQIRNHCKNSYNYLIPENEIVRLFFSLLILTESAKTQICSKLPCLFNVL